MATLEEAWKFQEHWSGDQDAACLLDLRARVEALEQRRAATEESLSTDVDSALLRTGMVTARHLATIKESLTVEPAPAPAADRPLWQLMGQAYARTGGHQAGYAAEIDAVAAWLAAREYHATADMLRAEAHRAREGRDD